MFKNILIIGNGGREQVIKHILKQQKTKTIQNIYNLKYIRIRDTLEFIDEKNIDFVIVGPEQPLVDGIIDILEENNIACFGPNKQCAKLEGSKAYSKKVMKNLEIPTSDYKTFTNYTEASLFIKDNFDEENPNYVIKVSGLASGKGVYLPKTKEEADKALIEIYIDNRFKKESNMEVVIEERLYGQEVSVLAFCNGYNIEFMPQAQDYKLSRDGDKGLNTGGMGSHAPVEIMNNKEIEMLRERLLPLVRQFNYRGVLYSGIMKTAPEEFYILEFNCRFGDPEAQVILNLLQTEYTDLLSIMSSCQEGLPMDIRWKSGYVANVVLSHIDYPTSKSKELINIRLDEPLDKNITMYPSGILIKKQSKEMFTYGGRIASIVSHGKSLYEALYSVYNNIHKFRFKDKYYRRDIGLKYLCNRFQRVNNSPHLLKDVVPRKIKVAVLGSTRGTSIQKLLDCRKEKNISVELIIANRKSAEIFDKAKKASIPFHYAPKKKSQTNEEYDRKVVDLLKLYDIELVFLVGYMRIVSSELIDAFRGKLFNIHPSLLPDHAGLMDLDVHRQVLESGDKVSGCTLHHVVEEVDGGGFILQKQCIIQKDETPETLKAKVQGLESECIIDCIDIFRNTKTTYKDSGVDIDTGNKLVENIKTQLSNEDKMDNIGRFCALYKFHNYILGASTDGVGSKLDLANDNNKLDTIGQDLVAMCVNDLICCGLKPLFFLDYIAVERLDNNKVSKIIKSIHKACIIADCKLIGGETAEMPSIYYRNKFDLAGFSVGAPVINDLILPKLNKIEKGDELYGLSSNGFHSNGYSLVRKIYARYPDSISIDTLLKPTRIYVEVLEYLKLFPERLLAMAHITGGGLPDNIERIIPNHLNYKLDKIKIKDEFKWIMEKAQLSYPEMLRTFNCGIGMVLVFKKGTFNDEVEGLFKIGEIV